MCAYTYKRIKKITENAVRLNRKRVNLKDNEKVMYLLGNKRKNAIMSDYVQNRLFVSQNGIRIKSLRSRRSIFPFSQVLLVCFSSVCIILSCEGILLSAFNGLFIPVFIQLQSTFCTAQEVFWLALIVIFYGLNCDFIRFFYRFLCGLYSFLIQLLQGMYNPLCMDRIISYFFRIIP